MIKSGGLEKYILGCEDNVECECGSNGRCVRMEHRREELEWKVN